MKLLRGAVLLMLFLSALLSTVASAGTWQLYAELDGIRIEYKYSDCNLEKGYDQEWVLLKLTNISGITKIVKWKSNLWYNNQCKTCHVSGQEYQREVSVKGGEILEGVCSIYGDGRLNIFAKFIDEDYQKSNVQVLTKFELANLNITAVE